MRYKIIFLGPKELLEREYQYLFEELNDIVDLEYRVQTDMVDVIEFCEKEASYFDGIMFSGLIQYRKMNELKERFDIPFYHLEFEEKNFYKNLVEILLKNKDLDFSRIFIDFLREDNDYYDIYSIIDAETAPYTIKNYPYIESQSDLGRVYELIGEEAIELFKENKIDMMLTRYYRTYEKLVSLGYNAKYFIPSKESIRDSFDELINLIDLNKLDKNRAATCMITFDKSEFQNEDFIFNVDSIQAEVCEVIEEYLDKIGIYNISLTNNNLKFKINTTKDTLVKLTDEYKESKILNKLSSKFNYKFNMGWGIGNTSIHADKNAIQANKLSSKYGGNIVFFIDNHEHILGPVLPSSSEVEFKDDKFATDISKKIPLSKMNISKIINIIKDRDTNKISSEILSEYAGITNRSANRILNTLYKYGVATIEEEKDSSKKGRPKKNYIVDFSNLL